METERQEYPQVVIMPNSQNVPSTSFAHGSQTQNTRANTNMVVSNDWPQLTSNRPASETLHNNNQASVNSSLSLNFNLQVGEDNFYQRMNQPTEHVQQMMRQHSVRDDQYFQNKDDMIISGQDHSADPQRPLSLPSLPPYGNQQFYVPDSEQGTLQQQFIIQQSHGQVLNQQPQTSQQTPSTSWWR